MTKFVDLDSDEQDIPVIKINRKSISSITPGMEIIDGIITDEEKAYPSESIVPIENINSSKLEDVEEESLCLKEDCSIQNQYGCTDERGYFLIDNLFSELTDDYQRTLARINLGIADEYALIWGNIKGNLLNQEDLYTFVTSSIDTNINNLINEINLKLSQWAYDINSALNLKANIYSPSFLGEPTTTLPAITDDSSRIASTEWVNAKIKEASIANNIEVMAVSPEYMCYGDGPTDVTVTWKYVKDVDSQSINDVKLDPDVRTYVFKDVISEFTITLDYSCENITESKVVSFEMKYPTYYGTSNDYTKLEKTVNSRFSLTANDDEFIYIFIPNGSETEIEVNSIIGGFILEGTIELYNNVYYVYRSYHSGLGFVYVQLSNFNDDYYRKTNLDTLNELLNTKADKSSTYSKTEVNELISNIQTGNISLVNYFTKEETLDLIPDVTGKADISAIPTKVSQLENDANYISSTSSEYVTESELNERGFLTKESDPVFTSSVAYSITISNINNWNNKVDSVKGKGLSTNDFTAEYKSKLDSLYNYDDSYIRSELNNIPTKVSQLLNDVNFISSYTETDPTVPDWAKQPNKPSYTLDELGAEKAGAANAALESAKLYADGIKSSLLDTINSSISPISSSILEIQESLGTKANSSELFSGNYYDLSGIPSSFNPSRHNHTVSEISDFPTKWDWSNISNIPDNIVNVNIDLSSYATKDDLDTKVDKVDGKGLSSNDFTSDYIQTINNLVQRIKVLENKSVLLLE